MSEQFNEPANYAILEALNKFSAHNDERLAEIKQRLTRVEAEVGVLKTKVTTIKATMVTKEYLDEKLAEHPDEPFTFVKSTDDKVKTVVQKLKDKKVFSTSDQNNILSMKPFAGVV